MSGLILLSETARSYRPLVFLSNKLTQFYLIHSRYISSLPPGQSLPREEAPRPRLIAEYEEDEQVELDEREDRDGREDREDGMHGEDRQARVEREEREDDREVEDREERRVETHGYGMVERERERRLVIRGGRMSQGGHQRGTEGGRTREATDMDDIVPPLSPCSSRRGSQHYQSEMFFYERRAFLRR